MFDITPDDIDQLNDTDLRELVGRLCEAELKSRGLSPAAVTWGGSQTASDGGLDVRVELPPGASVDGFIPRGLTGFQVRKPDMPRGKIIKEMRPKGAVRPAIQKLADGVGAYVIVSSHGSTSDTALRSRREAMREALKGVRNASQLQTDFYDRTRLATWVRCHSGLIIWAKGRIGRALVGWRPYGPWSGAAEGVEAEYLLDDKLRLHLGKQRDDSAQSVANAIDQLRDELACPGKIVRLVGLSGVGKTRLAQALFDARIGSRPLPPSLAVYTNLSANPDPQPTGLASDLSANRMRAVLIVDNCPPDLHRRLSELCGGNASTVSVLTIEYDVRDDQPEDTHVVSLDTSSTDLIEKLVRRRYPHVSQVDARTIAEFSGGNARIAIALAETVERSETIAGLSNEELFQRLFRQRHDDDNALLRAAQACSLVYSFQGEALTGEEAEIPRLASLAGQTAAETYSHVSELLRRDLAQQRGAWRAVLPHAIANRLAARALEDTPYDLIDQQLVSGGTERLARSFSRRLSFLHDHPTADSIVDKWLAPDGLLGDVAALNELGRTMFENVAPVLPEAALAALERAGSSRPDLATTVLQQHLSLLRSIAYDERLFERSAKLLVQAAMQGTDEHAAKEASDALVSLFTIILSGTHATVDQRLGVVESLLRSPEPDAQTLGLAAIDAMLEATHFSSSYPFEFGARSRNFGYEPQGDADVIGWYGAVLTLSEHLAMTESILKAELRGVVAQNFRGLWSHAQVNGKLETLCRSFSTDGFWREGWAACRQTMYFDRAGMAPEAVSRLSALEADLRPSNLVDRVRAVVLGNRSGGFDLEDMDADNDPTRAIERVEAIAHELGSMVATDKQAFTELLPELLRGGNRTWSFGRGLADASTDSRATWATLIGELEQIAREHRDVQVLRGFLSKLCEQSKDLAQDLLDEALDRPVLLVFLPVLQSAVGLDERGVERLKQALNTGQVPVSMYQYLALGRITDGVAGNTLKNLLLLIADKADGFGVALQILHMRLFSDRTAQRNHESELLEAGRELLQRATFGENSQREDHELAGIVKACLADPSDAVLAAAVVTRLKKAVVAHETQAFDNDDLLRALLGVQPAAVLDALFIGEEKDQQAGISVFGRLGDHRRNPTDAVSSEALIAWCEVDPKRRYPLAAWIITYASRSETNGSQVWSEHATALLTHAPDPRSILTVFINRFRPMSWSGSRAAVIEANSRLLENLDPRVLTDLAQFVAEAKTQLAQEIARERQWETEHDRVRDERFE